MRLKTGNIDVEIQYKKAGNDLVVPRPKIIMRSMDGKLVEQIRVVADNRFQWQGKDLQVDLKLTDPETGEEVERSKALEILKHYAYAHIDEDGKVIEKVKDGKKEILPVQHFVVNEEDGSEDPVSPFERTSMLEVPDENWVPSTSINGYLFESIYELFSDSPLTAKELFEEAEKRLKADQVGITNLSWGGFMQYYAFLCPLLREGKFVWLMKVTNTKLRYNHLQEPPGEVKVPIREAPTLKALPPVQALVVAAKKKKKA